MPISRRQRPPRGIERRRNGRSLKDAKPSSAGPAREGDGGTLGGRQAVGAGVAPAGAGAGALFEGAGGGAGAPAGEHDTLLAGGQSRMKLWHKTGCSKLPMLTQARFTAQRWVRL